MKTHERPLTRDHIESMKEIFAANQCYCEIRYFVYWPVLCGILPEVLALPITKALNCLNFNSKRADAVFLTVRKN